MLEEASEQNGSVGLGRVRLLPEDRDGVTFENREDLLPDHPVGYYKEYTVPTPGSDDRGAEEENSAVPFWWSQLKLR